MERPGALVHALEDILHDALVARDFGPNAYESTFESLLIADREGGLEAFRVFRSRYQVRTELEAVIPAAERLATAWSPIAQENLRRIGHQWWAEAEAEAVAVGAAIRHECRRPSARI